jgi:hypothetical protein
MRIKYMVKHIDVLALLVMFNNQDLHHMFAYYMQKERIG